MSIWCVFLCYFYVLFLYCLCCFSVCLCVFFLYFSILFMLWATRENPAWCRISFTRFWLTGWANLDVQNSWTTGRSEGWFQNSLERSVQELLGTGWDRRTLRTLAIAAGKSSKLWRGGSKNTKIITNYALGRFGATVASRSGPREAPNQFVSQFWCNFGDLVRQCAPHWITQIALCRTKPTSNAEQWSPEGRFEKTLNSDSSSKPK